VLEATMIGGAVSPQINQSIQKQLELQPAFADGAGDGIAGVSATVNDENGASVYSSEKDDVRSAAESVNAKACQRKPTTAWKADRRSLAGFRV